MTGHVTDLSTSMTGHSLSDEDASLELRWPVSSLNAAVEDVADNEDATDDKDADAVKNATVDNTSAKDVTFKKDAIKAAPNKHRWRDATEENATVKIVAAGKDTVDEDPVIAALSSTPLTTRTPPSRTHIRRGSSFGTMVACQ